MKCCYFFGVIGAFGLISSAFAIENASVGVFNLTAQPIRVMCELSEGTTFYNYPELSHEFEFLPMAQANDDGIDIKNENSDRLSMKCFQQEKPANYFNYQVEGDEEKTTVHGDFHYDKSYPGAFTFSE
jgi:hypothetical protein